MMNKENRKSNKIRIDDGFGNTFESIREMCKYHGIDFRITYQRLQKGMTPKEAILKPSRHDVSKRTDMNGVVYPTRKAMCDAYGIGMTTLKRREAMGWSIREILLGKEESQPAGVDVITHVLDDMGLDYKTEVLLGDFYGCSPELRARRMRYDFVVEIQDDIVIVIEHDGAQHFNQNHFNNGKEEFATIVSNDDEKTRFCKEHNIPLLRIRWDQYDEIESIIKTAADSLRNHGIENLWLNPLSEKEYYSIRQKPHAKVKVLDHTVQDHLGNTFSGYKEMAKAYNIAYKTLMYRLRNNWDIRKALTVDVTKTNKQGGKTVKDHLGNEYRNRYEMCKAYGIRYEAYARRISAGWTLERALTTPMCSTGSNSAMPIVCVNTGVVYASANNASKETGIPQANIWRVLHGRYKTAGGYAWAYAE